MDSNSLLGYQEPERHQPAQGQSRLGRDIQIGDFVEVTQTARRQGLYILGLQGYGKSGLLENLIIQDIKQNNIGVCVLDPKGELIDNVVARLPDSKKEQKVILFDINDKDYFPGLNLFACDDPTSDREIQFTLNQVTHVFEKAFGVSQPATPRIYDYLYNCAYVLITNPGYTMMDIRLLLNNATFRSQLLGNVYDEEVLDFWHTFYNPLSTSRQREEARQQEARELLRRLNDLTHDPLRYIIGQAQSTINMQEIMDEGKILLVKLNSRRFEKASKLIGSIIVALILNASANRLTKNQFNLYADEFQRFATEDFATLIEEARYAGIGITMAHQNRGQLELSDMQADANLKQRTLSVGNLVVFRAPTDAEELARQFAQEPEEARIEVQKPQEHRRIEEQVEVEVEEDITEISQNPVEYLKSARGTHGNARVREAAHTFLSIFATLKYPSEYGGELNRLLVDVMERRVETGTVPLAERIELLLYQFFNLICTPPNSDRCGYDIKSWLKKENNYLSEDDFCRWAQTRQRTLRVSSDEVNEQDVERLLCKKNFDNLFYDKINPERWGYPFLISEKLHRLAEQYEAMQQSVTVLLREMVIKSSSLSKAEKQLHAILSDYFLELARLSHFNTMEKKIREIHYGEIYVNPHKDMETWNELGKYYLTKDWEQIEKKWKPKLRSEKIMQLISDYKEAWHLTEEAVLAHVPVAVNDVVSFARTLLVLCEGLAQEPIMVPTGKKRMVKRIQPHITYLTEESEKITHPQPSEQEMTNRMARELINLPLYTARVKITTVKGTEEHTIRTLEPEKGLRVIALKERIARIQAQNRTPDERGICYCRPRQEIDAEIRHRQAQYNQPPEEPPEDEPPISRHPPR